MDINHQKEEFGNAYLNAVVATAGFTCYKPQVDLDSIDWGIAQRGGCGTYRSPRLELQLKCTSRNLVNVSEDTICYPLPKKNYEELRAENFLVPRILVVMLLPEKVEEWISQTHEELLLRHCSYWYSLYGKPIVENAYQITVHIPKKQIFTVDTLKSMMNRIGNGEMI